MKHLGDITKIDGFNVPLVDCIIGGSPCQDLSVAGKRAGLDGERSGLFMEQIRLCKELRENDRRTNNRANELCRCRYMVWENVRGAFSSAGGDDFRAVLEEVCKVADNSISIPRPTDKKGKWEKAGTIIGDGFSVAWRTFEASTGWYSAQRRERICLVADWGGYNAPYIVFGKGEQEPRTELSDTIKTITDFGNRAVAKVQPIGESLQGNLGTSEPKGEGTTNDTEGSLDKPEPRTLQMRGGCEVDSHGKKAGKGALITVDKTGTLGATQDKVLVDFGKRG